MRTKTGPNGSADRHVKEIKRKTRRKSSAEEKIRERGEEIAEGRSYRWIARDLGISKNTVLEIVQRTRKTATQYADHTLGQNQ